MSSHIFLLSWITMYVFSAMSSSAALFYANGSTYLISHHLPGIETVLSLRSLPEWSTVL